MKKDPKLKPVKLLSQRVEDERSATDIAAYGIGYSRGGYTAADGMPIPPPSMLTAMQYAGLRMIRVKYLPVQENEDVKDADEKEGEIIIPPQSSLAITPQRGFSIEELADRYRIHDVPLQGELCTVDISRERLENGWSYTQKEWTELTQNADWQKENGIWQLGSAPLQTAVITALHNNQNIADARQKDLVEKIRQLFMEDFKNCWMMTSTRIGYKSKGKDIVTHDWDYPTQTKIEENIAGIDGYIGPSCGVDSTAYALLGELNLTLFKNSFEWVSGKKPYLCRVNSKPNQDIELALVLGVSRGDFVIDALAYLSVGRSARGWSIQRTQKSP